MYSEKVMENFAHPKNAGKLENANAVGLVGNAACGDILKIYLRIENNIIEDVSFETFGCAAAIASSSMATEMVKGKTIEEALALKNEDIITALEGLPPQKIHCSVLAEEAIALAVEDYRKRQAESK